MPLKMMISGVGFAAACVMFSGLTSGAEKAEETFTCSNQGELKICVDTASIVPSKDRYVATVGLTFASSNSGHRSYQVLLPMGGATAVTFDADGFSDWRFDSITGALRCNNSNEENCKKMTGSFSTVNIGGGLTYKLSDRVSSDTNAVLAQAKKGSLTVRILIAPEGQAVRTETFRISGFPLKVITASK